MGELKYPLSLVIRAVDKATARTNAITSGIEKAVSRATAPVARLGNRLAALSTAVGVPRLVGAFQQTGSALGELGGKVLRVGGLLAGLGAAGGAAVLTIVREAQEAGGRLEDFSGSVGLSVNAFAELEFAAKRSGVENEAFAGAMGHLNTALSEAKRGTGPLAALLEKVGPVYLRQVKAVKSNEQGFDLLAKAMGRIKDPGKRAELAAAAFGKAGVGLVNALKDGPEGVSALREEFRRLVGDQTAFASGAGELGDAFDNLELSSLGLRNAFAGALFPAITKLSQAATDFITKNRDGIARWAERAGKAISEWVDGGGIDRLEKSISDAADTASKLVDKLGGLEGVAKLAAAALGVHMASSVVSLGASLGSLAVAISKTAIALGTTLVSAAGKAALAILEFNFAPLLAGLSGATAAVWSFTAALLANPITWVVVAVAALAGAAYLIYRNWDGIAKFFWERWDAVKRVFSGFLEWVGKNLSWTPLGMLVNNWDAVKTYFVGLWEGVKSAFSAAWDFIKPIVEKIGNAMKLGPLGIVVEGYGVARSMFSGGGASASMGAAAALPVGGATQTNNARVTVDFTNLPKGARVTPARENTAPLALDLGYVMGDVR